MHTYSYSFLASQYSALLTCTCNEKWSWLCLRSHSLFPIRSRQTLNHTHPRLISRKDTTSLSCTLGNMSYQVAVKSSTALHCRNISRVLNPSWVRNAPSSGCSILDLLVKIKCKLSDFFIFIHITSALCIQIHHKEDYTDMPHTTDSPISFKDASIKSQHTLEMVRYPFICFWAASGDQTLT